MPSTEELLAAALAKADVYAEREAEAEAALVRVLAAIMQLGSEGR